MSDNARPGGAVRPPSAQAGRTEGQDAPWVTGQPAGQDVSSGKDMASKAGQAGEKATEAVDATKAKATEAVDATKEKAGQLADKAAPKADAGIEKTAGGLDKAADLLRDKSGEMGAEGSMKSVATATADKLDVAAGYLKDKDSEQHMADLEALVRRKPVGSMVVALGVGFLLSKAIR